MKKGNTWYIIDYGLMKHKKFPKNFDDRSRNDFFTDALALLDETHLSHIGWLGFEKQKFKPNSFKHVVKIIKKSDVYPEIEKKLPKGISKDFKEYFIERICGLEYFDVFRKAFGAPDKMKIDPSISLIPMKKFYKIINNISDFEKNPVKYL